MVSDTCQSLYLKIDSRLANTTMVAMAVRGLCAMTTMSPVEINRLELCLVEIVNNSIEHAYEKVQGHSVEVLIELWKTAITITISDWGKPMLLDNLDSSEISDVDSEHPETWLSSGRGLHIVKSLMDVIDYKTENNKNSFIMTKQLRH